MTDLQTVETKAKAFYKDYPFYAGIVVGVILAYVVPFVVRHIL